MGVASNRRAAAPGPRKASPACYPQRLGIDTTFIPTGRPNMAFRGSIAFRQWLQIGLVALLGCGVARGQFLQRDGSLTKGLPASERETIDRLGGLGHLPMSVWRYHTGDLAHAEEPSLDDSTWTVAKPNSEYPEDALWFRQWVQVPKNLDGYDLTGARIWF